MSKHKYKYLIVGAGLFGSICAYELSKRANKVLVVDKRSHIGGNCYTERQFGINVHKYGAHIFHTNNKDVWQYINQFAEFNNYINSPIAIYNNTVYNLPFNMNTFSKLWPTVITPEDAIKTIYDEVLVANIEDSSRNLETKAISLVGTTIYRVLVKDYTEKQWGQSCKELSSDIITRLPVRFTYDNNYFTDRYQGIPIGGYTQIFEKLLENVDVRLNCDYKNNKDELENIAEIIIYTGQIDEYFDYCYGPLSYRTLSFEEKIIPSTNYQGNAVVNYTDKSVDYTRIIEHRHFEKDVTSGVTIISIERPLKWVKDEGLDPYYPVNNATTKELYDKYLSLAKSNIIFAGRLGAYKYFDMDDTIEEALKLVRRLCNES